MDKYLFEENGFVYELDSTEFYNLIGLITYHRMICRRMRKLSLSI